MGTLDLENEKYHSKRIRKALNRRGLKMDKDEDWEIHGPHMEMNYQVYVGYGYEDADPNAKCICPSKEVQIIHCKAHKRYTCVAIYPKAVYEIEDISDWWKAEPENRIQIS